MRDLLAFLALLAEQDEEDITVLCNEITRLGIGLKIGFDISTAEWDDEPRRVEVVCEEVLSYGLIYEAASSLELKRSHPLLWRFQEDTASAFFYGKPPDVDAAIGTLYEAHKTAAGGWISLANQINAAVDLRSLLASGNGLLARGPVSLLNAYKTALISCGIEVELRALHPHGGIMSDPQIHERLRQESQVLLFGGSHIVGIDWTYR